MKSLQEMVNAGCAEDIAAELAADVINDAAANAAKDALLAACNAEKALCVEANAAKDAQIVKLTADLKACTDRQCPPNGDVIAPSVPTGLTATVVSSTQINLAWSVANDNVAVVGYNVFRGGVQIGTTLGTSLANTGLTPATAYSYTVKARDAAGNMSAASAAVSATTSGVTPPAGEFVWLGLATPQLTREWMLANTGPRIALVNAPGGAVSGLQKGKRFTGTVFPANGTDFQDCEFNFGNGWGIDGDGRIFKVTRSTFKGTGGPSAILGNATVDGCNISGCQDGIKLQTSGAVRRSFIHDLVSPASDPHFDGIQIQHNSQGVVIEQNRVEARDTSEVFFQELGGQIDGGVVRHNWLGGSDLPVRIEAGCTNMKVIENIIVKGHWGYWDLNSTVVHNGNISGTAVDGKPAGSPID